MTSHSQDDAFHEIQLNGKQLVFLFMAATVVSVVIFLCGVLVGRGVRAERGTTVADASTLSAVSAAETTPQHPAAAPSTPAGSDPTAVAAPPPPAADDLSYFNRLEKPSQQTEELKPTPVKAAVAEKNQLAEKKAAADIRPAAPTPESVRTPAPEKGAAEPAGQGFTVQVAALNVRGEADAIANRLSSKGYAAYVISPANGTPSVFRVRVGKFGTRREAEAIATRLQKEEQFKPWITR